MSQANQSNDKAALSQYIEGLADFHVFEGDICQSQRNHLASFWQGIVDENLGGVCEVVASFRNQPELGPDFFRCILFDWQWIGNNAGSSFIVDDGKGELHLKYSHQPPDVSRHDFSRPLIYDLCFSTDWPNRPVTLYCHDANDVRRATGQYRSGYRNSDILITFGMISAMTALAFLTKKVDGAYSKYCCYTPDGWAQQKRIRDNERQRQIDIASRNVAPASRPAWKKVFDRLCDIFRD